jgi:hypothetical protein
MQSKWIAITLATSLSVFSIAHAETPMHGKSPMPPNHMKMMDSNQDGNISKAEFDAMHDKHFTEMDKNSDGNLSEAEMKAFHDAMHDHHGAMMRQKPAASPAAGSTAE